MTLFPRLSARALAVAFAFSLAFSVTTTYVARAESEEEEREEAARLQNNVHVANPAPGQLRWKSAGWPAP